MSETALGETILGDLSLTVTLLAGDETEDAIFSPERCELAKERVLGPVLVLELEALAPEREEDEGTLSAPTAAMDAIRVQASCFGLSLKKERESLV